MKITRLFLRHISAASCLLAIGCAVYAQTAQVPLSFEVASLKPSQGDSGSPMPGYGRYGGGPGTNSPGQFTATGMSLRILLFRIAYNLQDSQYEAPNWMGNTSFDVVAKVPPGTTREQFRVMLQNFLIERFQIKLHHEPKEVPVYDLVVAKSGSKLKQSPIAENAASQPMSESDARTQLQYGPDGFPLIPSGPGLTTLAMVIKGQQVIVTNHYKVQQLAAGLAANLHRPVFDKTGLEGFYAFTVHYTVQGLPSSMLSAGGTASDPDPAPTLFEALPSQLGLKLEQHKGPVDVLVIDHAEKVPIEN